MRHFFHAWSAPSSEKIGNIDGVIFLRREHFRNLFLVHFFEQGRALALLCFGYFYRVILFCLDVRFLFFVAAC